MNFKMPSYRSSIRCAINLKVAHLSTRDGNLCQYYSIKEDNLINQYSNMCLLDSLYRGVLTLCSQCRNLSAIFIEVR